MKPFVLKPGAELNACVSVSKAFSEQKLTINKVPMAPLGRTTHRGVCERSQAAMLF